MTRGEPCLALGTALGASIDQPRANASVASVHGRQPGVDAQAEGHSQGAGKPQQPGLGMVVLSGTEEQEPHARQ